jgi:LDH2 family malate/lactate/ureidoglycolate dehydrogenase
VSILPRDIRTDSIIRIPADVVSAFIAECVARIGLPPADAAKVAELMTEADLVGADAHGVFRLPQYVQRTQAGGFNPRPNITVTRTASATALVDGDNGFGHLVMARAAETAIAIAREAGIGWVGVRRSNHAGAAGVYAAMPLAHDMIGLYSAVANANHMAAWGGTELLLGTNPLAVAIPASEEAPVVLDVATSIVSYGTIKNYRLQHKPMPEGWMVDAKTGETITDPANSGEGLLLPMGGYKGAGLAIVLGLLAGTLNGAAFGRDVIDFNADDATATNTGHFIVALDVSRFMPIEAFKSEVDRHLCDLRNSKRLPGVEAIRLPGAERAKRRADRLAHGIPISGELMAKLDKLADEMKVKPLSAH